MKAKTIISVVVATILLALSFGSGYFLVKKEERRWQENFDAAIGKVVKEIRNDQALYHKEVITLTKAEMKEFYANEWEKLVKEYKLKDPQQLTSVNTVTTNQVNTILRDSNIVTRINDTIRCKKLQHKFQSFDINLLIKPNDSVSGSITHHLNLKIVLSKQKREGLNKVLLRPWKRSLVTTAIPSDSSTIITDLKTIIIK